MRRRVIPLAAGVLVLAGSATFAALGDRTPVSNAALQAKAEAAPALIAASTNPRARLAVMAQIDAIRRNDTRSAYGMTAEGVKRAFPTGDAFMTMIRTYYPAMQKPRALALGPYGETQVGPIQIVFISGKDGSNWIAYFQLEKQSDGSMKISGCTMIEDQMPMI